MQKQTQALGQGQVGGLSFSEASSEGQAGGRRRRRHCRTKRHPKRHRR